MAEATLTKKRQTSKFEGGSAQIADEITTATTSDSVRAFGYLIRTLEVQNLAGGSDAIFTVEGGFRRDDGTIDWYTLATRADASATFSTGAITLATDDQEIYEISPTPVTDYVRINISDASASGVNAWVHVEL